IQVSIIAASPWLCRCTGDQAAHMGRLRRRTADGHGHLAAHRRSHPLQGAWTRNRTEVLHMAEKDILDKVFDVIEQRKAASPDTSYVAKLMAGGPEKI